ncbi:nucleotidyl transferase AbiEii/AbiGii toxin family protein [Lacrimispora saccharolytica]|nr:nucleotidyl transferase AbiEii/AbiGii toxin family protein [Lacrimispora saccharolytica]
MIKTARQLKDLIRNLSKKNAADAQILMRNYMMERFLERISLSSYRDKFILKGGMLVAAMVGLDARSTMDLDAMLMCRKVTHKNLIDSNPLFPCNKEKAMYNLHLNDIILLGQSKGKIKVYAP